ncbi:MAG TPA: adenosylmethionine--8-amino-7-oxononanoate transaminase [Kofleriaceae bacterium]|nr:adenosylmethionine--8-amino-7-oxononanoate transaminase [Kofleriaceae bacterium]
MTSSRTEHWIELDKQYLWHPFTPMRQWLDGEPLVIERAEGNYLIDSEGRRYLDGVASLWVNVHGHNRPEINRAIREQLERMAHSTMLGLAHPTAAELAERLVGCAPPGLARVFYSDNGSTAVEVALKVAFQFWQLAGRPEKRRFVHLEQAYHGDTLGAVAVGGIPAFHATFGPLLLETLAVPTPHPYRHPSRGTPAEIRDQSLAALESLLQARGHEIAAFILEPLVQGAAGMLVHPDGYLAGAAALCREHDVLLIADEVATGFGRTGTLFACTQEQVTPDLLCLAKGLTGGYTPLAATLMTHRVYEQFLGARPAERRTFFHGHSFTGHPLGCAAALASLDLFERDLVIEQLPGKIDRLRAALASRLAGHPNAGDIRQRGLMVGIELVADRATAAPFPAEAVTGARVCAAARGHGVLLRPLGDVVVLMPPLSITDDEIDLLVDSVAAGLADVL